ncbi:MAG: hypothetical protein E7624_05885 [Ruminococcaceae bacterium]|nr:hypothetical protein [Oscillospiraceae bacterium]
MKLKQYEVVSNVEFFKEPIRDTLKRYRTIKKWAFVLHDKDPDETPHYHIYLNFGNSGVDSKVVAGWFGLQESQVSKILGRNTDMFQYLTHSQPSQKHKYQYSPSEVVANFDIESEIEQSKILGDFKKYSYAQQLEYIDSLPVSEKTVAFTKLQNLWKLHCQCMMLDPERNVEVVFIQGKGGAGKTYYAKKFLKSLGYDYCISSSSNDPFQDYLGQKAMILDDLRDRTFEFEDLLKILDNNTASSVRSRFSNKVFNGKMIVITSTVPLSYWYMQYRYSDFDTLNQLYRRISCYVVVEPETVKVYEKIDDRGRPVGVPWLYKNELSKAKKEERTKTDFGAAFGKICEDAVPEFLDQMSAKKNT